MLYTENILLYHKTGSKVLAILRNFLTYKAALIQYVQLTYIQTKTNDTVEHWSPHPDRQLIL
jgi:hypothetical protein